MSEETRPIVVKRIKKVAGGHHGGAWKLAYADFVTAMMAFFLLMWLLSSVSSNDLKGLSEYFQNPRQVSFTGGSGSGDAMSILQGGGKDISSSSGQKREGESTRGAANLKRFATEALRREFEEREKKTLTRLKDVLENLMVNDTFFRQFKSQLMIEAVPEGLRIQIIDEQNRPMFDSSSSELKPYSRTILREIGRALNSVPNRISVSGHTDALQFSSSNGFSNWELSANRANASRREMIAGGMDESKVLRVVGLSSIALFDRNDPLSPSNRRINITVLNKRTEEAMLYEDANMLPEEEGAPVPAEGAQAAPTVAPPLPVTQSAARRSIAGGARR